MTICGSFIWMTKKQDLCFSFDSPIGRLLIFYRPEPFAFTRICLPQTSSAAKEAPVHASLPDHPAITDMADRLDRYFSGRSVSPPWDILCFDGLTALQLTVLKATADIPFGGLRSYGQVAAAIGRPRACRFVGTALSKNPFPLLIPCHRVIRSDGGIGGFGSGISMKRKLLALEGICDTPCLRSFV